MIKRISLDPGDPWPASQGPASLKIPRSVSKRAQPDDIEGLKGSNAFGHLMKHPSEASSVGRSFHTAEFEWVWSAPQWVWMAFGWNQPPFRHIWYPLFLSPQREKKICASTWCFVEGWCAYNSIWMTTMCKNVPKWNNPRFKWAKSKPAELTRRGKGRPKASLIFARHDKKESSMPPCSSTSLGKKKLQAKANEWCWHGQKGNHHCPLLGFEIKPGGGSADFLK